MAAVELSFKEQLRVLPVKGLIARRANLRQQCKDSFDGGFVVLVV